MSEVELESHTEVDMWLFIERRIQEAIFMPGTKNPHNGKIWNKKTVQPK